MGILRYERGENGDIQEFMRVIREEEIGML